MSDSDQKCIECHKYRAMDEDTPRCRFCVSGNYDRETHKGGPRLEEVALTVTDFQLGEMMNKFRETGLSCAHGLCAANDVMGILCYCYGKRGITADSAMVILCAAQRAGIYNPKMEYIVGAYVIDAWNITPRAKILAQYNKELRSSEPYSTADKDAALNPDRPPIVGPNRAVWEFLRIPPPPSPLE